MTIKRVCEDLEVRMNEKWNAVTRRIHLSNQGEYHILIHSKDRIRVGKSRLLAEEDLGNTDVAPENR